MQEISLSTWNNTRLHFRHLVWFSSGKRLPSNSDVDLIILIKSIIRLFCRIQPSKIDRKVRLWTMQYTGQEYYLTSGKQKCNFYNSFPNETILDLPKLKEFAHDKMKVADKFVFRKIEILWEKEIMLLTSIFPFPWLFSEDIFLLRIENLWYRDLCSLWKHKKKKLFFFLLLWMFIEKKRQLLQ